MGTTSYGSLTLGLVIALLGVGLLLGGLVIADEVGFMGEASYEEQHGPFGLFGSSESSTAYVNILALMGLVLGTGGILALVVGLLIAARALDRGKDREVELQRIEES